MRKQVSIMDGMEITLLPNPAKLVQRSNLTEPTMNNQPLFRPAVVKPMRKPAFSKVPTNLDTGPLHGGSSNLMIGSGMSAPLLKQFIDYSYLGNTSIAPAGYSIDAPLSDSRVKVYTKNGSNDKDVIVTHRGSVGLDDWMDNASYMFRGKVKGTKTYNLHRDRHKKAVDKYGASNIIAIGHSRAGLYLQELQKEFPIKENITYNKASGFHDIGRQNADNQTDVRVGNDVVSLLAPLQRRPNKIVKIDGTKNPFDFNAAHQTSEINKVGDQFIGKQEGSGRGRKRKVGGMKNTDEPPLPPDGDPFWEKKRKMAERWAKKLAAKHARDIEEAPEKEAKRLAKEQEQKDRAQHKLDNPPKPKVIPKYILEQQAQINTGYYVPNLNPDKLNKHFGSEETQRLLDANASILAKRQGASGSNEGTAYGGGTLPVISSVEGIKRLIAIEQARLRKIKKGYSYESPTMTKEKLEEKVARLKERLKSAKKSKEGHADVSYFIPKSIKWLKIMAGETRVGSDAYNRLLLEAIKKLLAELSGKKPTATTKKKTATLEEDRDKLEKIIEPKKKGYSKKTPNANKPAPVIIPPSSLTNERASIRAAVNREKTYNKVIDDKQQEDFKVILRAMVPDPPPAQAEADAPQQTKEELRRERAREAARRQRARDKPSGFEQAQAYNRDTRQRQSKAKQYGIPTREYTSSLKRSAQIERELEKETDEEKKKVIREERNKLRAKYSYLDEIMNSDNTEANRANKGVQPKVVEAEVEPPLAGSGMYGGSMCGGGYKYIITPKTEEYNLLH